jgi:3-isopropylmalate/(R)-2-methylmalate dehydratase small subunit
MLKKSFAGKAFILGDHVNTDILHPPDYFSLKKDTIASGLSKGAEDFISKMGRDDIIVAGRNFGCGSSRESSARSFAYNGIEVIIAESFARIFYRNLTNQGIYLITCPGITKKAEQGEPIRIDLEKNEISSQRRDWRLTCNPLPIYVKSVLGKGGLIKFLEDRIAINKLVHQDTE